MGRVIVVGSINVDMVVRVVSLPAAGATVVGEDLVQHHGGKGGNQAVAAARAGASVFMVGAVGTDQAGDAALEALAREAVDVTHVAQVSRATGTALIVVNSAGDNQIAVAPGANHDVSADHVREALGALGVGPGDVVLVSCEIPGTAVAEALGVARDVGALSVLNPAPAAGLDPNVARLADVLTPNETELGMLTPDGEPTSLIDREGQVVVVTRGVAGATLHQLGAAPIGIPVPAVAAVDATGAGDTFNGFLAAGLSDGISMREAVGRAVAAASLSTTRPGAREGMPTAAELTAFIGGLG